VGLRHGPDEIGLVTPECLFGTFVTLSLFCRSIAAV
jgi:hypothetical protein